MGKVKTFFKGIFFILLYFLLSLIIYSFLYQDIYNETNLIIANIATIFADLLILFIFIFIFRKKIIPDFYNFKKDFQKYIKDYYKYWLVGLGLMIVSNLIISLIIGDMPTNEEVNRTMLLNLPLSSIISMVIVAPIIEELITRKTFKEVFNKEYIYILFSGLLFGSLHLLAAENLLEILYIIPYTVLGCAFAKMYYDSDNIWVNIFFHSIHNLIAILIIFLGV